MAKWADNGEAGAAVAARKSAHFASHEALMQPHHWRDDDHSSLAYTREAHLKRKKEHMRQARNKQTQSPLFVSAAGAL